MKETMGRRFMRARLPVVLVFLALASCDDGLGPLSWVDTPTTSVIYSLSRPELVGQPSAYDFVQLRRIVVESPGATGGWDIVLAEQNGTFVFLPSGEFPGIESRAAITKTDARILASVREAPGDTASYTRGPLPVVEDAVYVIRTRTASCITFGTGTFYAKFQVLSLDTQAGTAELAVVRNPYCSDRKLVPPKN